MPRAISLTGSPVKTSSLWSILIVSMPHAVLAPKMWSHTAPASGMTEPPSSLVDHAWLVPYFLDVTYGEALLNVLLQCAPKGCPPSFWYRSLSPVGKSVPTCAGMSSKNVLLSNACHHESINHHR